MRWSDIPRSPSDRTLRQFAAFCLLLGGGLALWQGWGTGNLVPAAIVAAAALAVGIPGLLRPQTLRWIYVGWMMAAFPIGWVFSTLLLALVFFGVVTPLAMLFRLMGRDALRRRSNRDSYWTRRPLGNDVRRYFRQW